MPGAISARGVHKVLSGPAVRRTFTLALVGRLAYGLLPLCFLFTIRNASDSFALAATATAAFGFATLAMPLQARFVDRHGQRLVLPCYTAGFITVLIVLALLSRGTHPDALWLVLGLLLGLTAPALGPAMRAQWREISKEGAARRVAYSLDSVGEESLYLIGPLGASLLLAIGNPEAGLVIAAGFVLVGTAALALSPYVPASGPPVNVRHAGSGSPDNFAGSATSLLLLSEFRGLLLAMVLFGSAGAACFVGVAALADRADQQSAVGIIEASMAVGAILAGLCWARLRREMSWRSALLVLLLILASAQVAAALAAPHLALVGALLVITGAVAAPIFVVAFTAADSVVAPAQRTEASTWVTTSINVGNSAGTALAGLVAVGNATPFVLAACMTTGGILLLGVTLVTGDPPG